MTKEDAIVEEGSLEDAQRSEDEAEKEEMDRNSDNVNQGVSNNREKNDASRDDIWETESDISDSTITHYRKLAMTKEQEYRVL